MVAADQRHPRHPAEQGRGDAGRAWRGDVDEVVAALGEDLDQVREAGDAEGHPLVEGDVEPGSRRQPPVDPRIGADDLDLEAGHAELANLLDRAGDAVHRLDPVGDQRDAGTLRTGRELRFLGAEEGGRGRIGDDRHDRVEEPAESAEGVAGQGGLGALLDRGAQPSLVDAAGAAVEVGVREAVGLQVLDQLAPARLDADRPQPCLEQRPAVVGADVGGDLALAGGALADHPLRHLQHGAGVGRALAPGPSVEGEGAGRERHRRVRPLGGGALLAAGLHLGAVAQLAQKLFRRRRGRRLGEGAADVHAGVIVGTADAGSRVGFDVEDGGHVELRRARAVADLPDREELRQASPVAARQRAPTL